MLVTLELEETMKKLFSAIFATVVVVAAANAQTAQTTVTVDKKDYIVTEMMATRSGRMVQIVDPEGKQAVISVTNDGKIAYLSPPGGIYNGVDYKPGINQVWAAYLAQKQGTAPAGPTTGNAPIDPNAALAAQAAAIAAHAQARANGTTIQAPDGERAVKNITNDSITVYDPTLKADVTFTENLMKAEWSITPQVPAGLPTVAQTQYYTAFFEGGDKPAGAGAKAGKVLKGTLIGIGDGMNTRANATNTIGADPDKMWRVNEKTGKVTQDVYESGGMRNGQYVGATGRDPMGNIGLSKLVAVRVDLDFAKAAIETAQQNGQATGFNLSADRFQRGTKALEDAINGLQ
jgi:hypothetical protein